MTTEQRIRALRIEANALKQAFMASATQINLITKNLAYSTKKNLINQGGFTYEDQERVVVTYASTEGVNTLAKLEITGDYDTVPIVRRVPYSGGARWVVSNAPKMGIGGWQATNYTFTVQAVVNGTITAKMIWE